jgi:hypothetical protein
MKQSLEPGGNKAPCSSVILEEVYVTRGEEPTTASMGRAI